MRAYLRRLLDRATTLLSIVFLLLGGFFMLRPGGIVREHADRFLEHRATKRQIQRSWPELVQSKLRLDRGAGEASVVIFEDYQCGFCRMFQDSLNQLLARFPDIGIVVRHFPWKVHERAEGAARASICAGRMGRFRDMRNHLFATDTWESDGDWVREAAAIGIVDTSAFVSCLQAETTAAALQADIDLANVIGVRATPSVVTLRGGMIRGIIDSNRLLRLVRP